MDKLIESVVKAMAEYWGATASISVIIANLGVYIFRTLVKRRQDKKAAEDLKPEFDYLYINHHGETRLYHRIFSQGTSR